jgi:hypothetical protein
MVAVNFLWPPLIAPSSFSSLTAIAATGEKIAFCGQFQHADNSAKSIERLQFRFGTVTKAGGSALTVSLQDVDATIASGIIRPDETQDQTVAIANADAAFVTNGFIRTGTFSANRSVSNGDWLAVVVEYDGSGRLGSDSVQMSLLSQAGVANSGAVRKTGVTWASAGTTCGVILECTDGSFGYLSQSPIVPSTIATRSFASSSTPDERGISFTASSTTTIDAVVAQFVQSDVAADVDLVIYENGTAIHTQAFNAAYQRSVDNGPNQYVLSSRVTFTSGSTYYVCFRPSTTTNVRLFEYQFNDAKMIETIGYPAGTGIISRTDAGAWSSVTTTSLFLMLFRVVDVAASGSSGIPIARGMHGGMR